MLDSHNSPEVFIVLGSTDMRKAINGLSTIVFDALEKNPFSGSYFVFCSANRKQIKILYYDRNGFCLWQKRLETGRFIWPESSQEVLGIGYRELRWLLDGLNPTKLKGHPMLEFKNFF